MSRCLGFIFLVLVSAGTPAAAQVICEHAMTNQAALELQSQHWALPRDETQPPYSDRRISLSQKFPQLSREELLEAYFQAADQSEDLALEIRLANSESLDRLEITALKIAPAPKDGANRFKSFFRNSNGGHWLNLDDLSPDEKIRLALRLATRPKNQATHQIDVYSSADSSGRTHRNGGYSGMAMPSDFDLLDIVTYPMWNFLRRHQIPEPESLEDLQRVLLLLSQNNPALMPASAVHLAWDRQKDVLLGTQLISLALGVHARGLPVPSDSLDLILDALGISRDAKAALQSRSANTLKELYSPAVELAPFLPAPAFEGIPVDPAVLSKKNLASFTQLLVDLRNLFNLKGGTPEQWPEILEFLEIQKSGLNEVALHEIQPKLEQAILAQVKALFGNTGLELDYPQLHTLQKKWNDSLEPIFTLLGRFTGNPEWKDKEVPYLAEIFKALLQGRFAEFKFRSAEQLSPLTDPGKIAEWRRQATRLEVLRTGSSASEQEEFYRTLMQNLKGQARNTLVPHLQTLLKQEGSDAVGFAAFHEIFAAHAKNPSKAAQILLRKYAKVPLLEVAASAILGSESLEQVRALLSFIKTLVHLGELSSAEIRQDVLALTRILELKPKSPGVSLVFSTSFNDAKTLIRVGDLVNTSSCQNYRNGSIVSTLLGYVGDANTQGLASFLLSASQFSHPLEFQKVVQAVEAGQKVTSSFDGESETITIGISSGSAQETVVARVPQYAHLRRLIKLGTASDGEAGVVLEPPYEQVNSASGMMRAQLLSIRDEFARRLGAATRQPVTVAESLNPLYIYSDAANRPGIQEREYTVVPLD